MQKVIVITGGAGGMGLATAKLLISEDYHVVISDISQAKLDQAIAKLRQQKDAATSVVCDITDYSAVENLLQRAQTLGQVVGVIHSAGVSPRMGEPSFIVNINALGTINVAEASLEIAGKGFSLVNVASIAGHMTPRLLTPKRSFARAFTNKEALSKKLTAKARFAPKKMRSGQAYSLSKSFVIWYTEKIAAKFGSKGARVVSVSPGSFDTSMGRLEKSSGSDKLVDYAALKRFGDPEEVAELLAFLGKGEARYITGTDILIDGGVKAGLSLKDMLDMARSN